MAGAAVASDPADADPCELCSRPSEEVRSAQRSELAALLQRFACSDAEELGAKPAEMGREILAVCRARGEGGHGAPVAAGDEQAELWEEGQHLDDEHDEEKEILSLDVEHLRKHGYARARVVCEHLHQALHTLLARRHGGAFIPEEMKIAAAESCKDHGYWKRADTEAEAIGVDKEALHCPYYTEDPTGDMLSPWTVRGRFTQATNEVHEALNEAAYELMETLGFRQPELMEGSENSLVSLFDYQQRRPTLSSETLADAHEDRGVLTFIVSAASAPPNSQHSSHSQSLQVMRAGAASPSEWIDADATHDGQPSSAIELIVLVGHTMEAATGGVLKASQHRVQRSVDAPRSVPSSRQSVVFKFRAADDTVIDPRMFPCDAVPQDQVHILPTSRYPARSRSHGLIAYRVFG